MFNHLIDAAAARPSPQRQQQVLQLVGLARCHHLDMPVDDIQAQLDKVSGSAQVENDLAALKAELSTSGPAGELPGPAEDKVVDVEASPAAPAEPQPAAAEPAPAPGEQGGGA